MRKPKDVNAYITSAPKEARAKLRQLRAIIRKTAPSAIEKISYGMPYYGYKGRLVYFAYAKKHLGFYVMPKTLKDYEKDVQRYRTGKATLSFAWDAPLPAGLIKKLVRAGVRKNEAKK